MISCRNLTCRFGNKVAVKGVSFALGHGAICALLGPNGAGKSTILSMLSGLIPPSEGQATVADVEVARGSIQLRRSIGVLPESLGLFDDLTVEEHLLLTADVYGVARSEALERIERLLRLMDLERGRNTFISESSHGKRKKTAISMALLPKPKVLPLDEPFEGVDPVTAKLLQRTLLQISGRTKPFTPTNVYVNDHDGESRFNVAALFGEVKKRAVDVACRGNSHLASTALTVRKGIRSSYGDSV